MKPCFARIVEITNPFDPWNSLKCHDLEFDDGLTILEWLAHRHAVGTFGQFDRPTICYLNGIPILREKWMHKIQKGDLIQFYTLPGDVVTIVIAIIAIIVAIVAIVMMPTPTTPGGQPPPDPIFTRSGQYNRSRPGEPIEVAYGKVTLFPSYAGRSYNLFDGNQQYQFNLYCLGQGYFDLPNAIHRLEDTELSNFDEVLMQIVEPGEKVTLFRTNVQTSAEVANIELFAPNQDEYPDPDGWFGWFAICDPGDVCDRIEFDTVNPNGLYSTNDKGKLRSMNVRFEFEWQLIDDANVAIGPAVSSGEILLTARSTTPQRRTWGYDVPEGRYQVRARRTSNKSGDMKDVHQVSWYAVRAFLPNIVEYGDVTLVAMKIRASNNINDNSRGLYNVTTTRLLPWYNTEQEKWMDDKEDLIATRSLIWAFCDIFRAKYGGGPLGRFLHLEQLVSLVDFYEDRGEHFDWIFDQKVTVAEAAGAVARVGRGVPMMIGNRMGIIRDAPASIPTAIFSPDNIVSGSFTREFRFFDFDPYDCVDITYRDPISWDEKRVRCVLPESTQNNPQLIQLSGCTDRTHAYHEGMYIAAQDRYVREKITFRTGMEGYIPMYGDLISVSHDLIRVGTSGLVYAMDNDTIPGRTVLQLSDSVKFGWPELEIPENPDTRNRVIVVRTRDGEVYGPIVVQPGANSREIQTVVPLDLDRFVFEDTHELPLFQFGVADRYAKLCKVTALKPGGTEDITVECLNYDARVHSFDTLEAPPETEISVPPLVPALPLVANVILVPNPNDTTTSTLSWDPSFGAKTYIVEISYDNETWDQIIETPLTSTQISPIPGAVWIRVAAVNLGRGPWAYWDGLTGVPNTVPATPTGFAAVGTWVLDLDVEWDLLAPGTYDGFDIRIYNNVTNALLRHEEFGPEILEFTYTNVMGILDGVSRELRLELTAENLKGDSAAAALVLSNALPVAPTGLTAGSPTGTSYPVSWTHTQPADFSKYRVYASTTPGFTPAPGNLVWEGTANNTTIIASVTTYWRVSAGDKWGPEEAMSAQAQIL